MQFNQSRNSLRGDRVVQNKVFRSIHSPTNKWSQQEEKRLLSKVKGCCTISEGKIEKIDWQKVMEFFPNRTREAIRSKYMQIVENDKEKKVVVTRTILKPTYSLSDKSFILKNVAYYSYKEIGEMMTPVRSGNAIRKAFERFTAVKI